MVKLVLFGDMHLDAKFRWLSGDAAAARARRQAIRDTFIRIMKLTADEKADALLCSGDLFEQDRVSPDTGEFLRKAFAELSPTPVFIAPGNHDYLAPGSIYRSLAWSENVHIFQEGFHESAVELDPGLVLWGTAHKVPANTPNFFQGFRVPPSSDTHLALAHASELGWIQQASESQQPHAPFSAEDIEASGFAHAFLGHIHTPKDAERFTYPGNPEPLTFGEVGERGPVIVTLDDSGSVRREKRVVTSTEVALLSVDLTGCASQQDIRDRITSLLGGLSGYLQVRLHGDVEPSVDIQTSDLQSLKPDGVKSLSFESSQVTVNYDFESIASESSVRGQFVTDVLADDRLEDEERRRILVTGLRALEGRRDLELIG